jgi:O-antigen/teichoic acid export membrane protein
MIARSLVSQWAATVYVAAVSMALVFALGRVLGPDGFGEYSYFLTLASLFAILQDGGFRTLLFREGTAVTPELDSYGHRLLPMALGHLILVSGLICLLVAVFAFSLDLLFAVGCLGLVTLVQFVSARLKAEANFVREAGWQMFARTTSALAIVSVLLFSIPQPAAIFAAWMGGLALALAVAPAGRAGLCRPQWAFVPQIYKACLAFAVIDFATAVYFKIDVVMLRQITGDSAQVGYYSAAYRLLEGVILLAAPVTQLCFRELRLRWDNRPAFRQALIWMVLGMMGASMAAVLAGQWLGPVVIDLAYGKAYQPAYGLLPWLLATLFFALPNYVLTQGAIALNKEKFYAVAACGAAAVNVLLNFWLIPGSGTLGAIWATLATEAFLGLVLVGGMRSWLMAKA